MMSVVATMAVAAIEKLRRKEANITKAAVIGAMHLHVEKTPSAIAMDHHPHHLCLANEVEVEADTEIEAMAEVEVQVRLDQTLRLTIIPHRKTKKAEARGLTSVPMT